MIPPRGVALSDEEVGIGVAVVGLEVPDGSVGRFGNIVETALDSRYATFSTTGEQTEVTSLV
jgi:hypothetical protein